MILEERTYTIIPGQVKDYLKGNPKPFEVYERKYIFLSFAGKLALAGGLGYGLILRTASC